LTHDIDHALERRALHEHLLAFARYKRDPHRAHAPELGLELPLDFVERTALAQDDLILRCQKTAGQTEQVHCLQDVRFPDSVRADEDVDAVIELNG